MFQTSCRALQMKHKILWWTCLTMNWYLIQTKPNAHVTARDNLRRQGFNVFLPLINKTTKKNNKFLETKAPLFPILYGSH